MAQYRPLPPEDGDDDIQPAEISISRHGWRHNVSTTASDTLASAARRSGDSVDLIEDLTNDVSVAAARDLVGREGFQRAADDAGAPRSARTIRRWIQNGKIPTARGRDAGNARTAELLQRRAFVARQGGADNLAAQLGTTVSTVSHWQTGTTENMRGAAASELDHLQLDDALELAGKPPITGARITATAGIEYRHAGDRYQEVGPNRAVRTATVDLAEQDARELALAIRAGDWSTVTAIVEGAWTAKWGTLAYSDTEGVHIVEVESFDIDWL